MLLFDQQGYRYKARVCERKPKFLTLKKPVQIQTYEKTINGENVIFYKRVGEEYKYIVFQHQYEWYKIEAEKLKDVNELYETSPLQTKNKPNCTSTILYDEKYRTHPVRAVRRTPKYLTIKESNILNFKKKVNGKNTNFYHHVGSKTVQFLYQDEWFEIKKEKFDSIKELFDIEHIKNAS